MINIVNLFPTSQLFQLYFLKFHHIVFKNGINIKVIQIPNSFLSQDLILYERVSIINEYIKSVNQAKSVRSPRFDQDLRRVRKSQGDSHKRTSLNFSNYKDGIHTKPLLARCWMKRSLLHIFADRV